MQRILPFIILIFIILHSVSSAFAASPIAAPKDSFTQATVVSLSPQKKTLEAKIATGKKVPVTYEPQSSGQIHVQDTVVIAQTGRSGSQYYFVDQYRITPLIFMIFGFFLLILLIAGWKGIGSIAGLCISVGVIFFYIVPQILGGGDPLTICMIGAVGILFVTTFVAHGVSKQTVTALIGTLMALVATYFLAQLVGHIVLITGYGNEDAVNLQFALPHMLQLKGLFLGGIILATLGALNDITITQAASIFSLRKANPTLEFKDLAIEGYVIGREHALSLVNTLVLAFAGSSLAIFIFVVANPNGQPLWVILNSEFLVEEIVKILAGTAGLLLAVPLVTLLAALVCDREVQRGVRRVFAAFF